MTIKALMLAGVAGATILATVPFSPFAAMAQNTYAAPDQGQSGDNQPQQMKKRQQGQTSDDQSTREMRRQRAEGQQADEQGSRDMKREGRKEGRVAYDRDRHGERMRHREGRYRNFHEGYYYASPWWSTGIVVAGGGGISCREGARIASSRGFNRVVPVDCGGETFTYRGWRGGDPWRVRIDSDSGRIIAVRPAG